MIARIDQILIQKMPGFRCEIGKKSQGQLIVVENFVFKQLHRAVILFALLLLSGCSNFLINQSDSQKVDYLLESIIAHVKEDNSLKQKEILDVLSNSLSKSDLANRDDYLDVVERHYNRDLYILSDNAVFTKANISVHPGGSLFRLNSVMVGLTKQAGIGLKNKEPTIVVNQNKEVMFMSRGLIFAQGDISLNHTSDSVIVSDGLVEPNHSSNNVVFSSSKVVLHNDGLGGKNSVILPLLNKDKL